MTTQAPQKLTIDQALNAARQEQFAGRIRQAELLYRQILSANPDHPDANHMLGVLGYQTGHHKAAIDLVRKAIRTQPSTPEFYGSLALIQIAINDFPGAVESCQKAVKLRPSYPDAHNIMANALYSLGRIEESLAAYRQALKHKPDFPEVHSNMGNALYEHGQTAQAIAACKTAIALRPLFPDAHYNLANAYYGNNQFDKSIASYRQAIALRPGFPKAYNNLGNVLKDAGFIDEAIICYEQSLQHGRMPTIESNKVYLLQFHPRYNAQQILAEARQWNGHYAKPLIFSWPNHSNDRNPDRKLRIGYISPDFRDHVVGRNILPLLRHHDKSQFEIFCYAQLARPDDFSKNFESAADHWRNISTLSDKSAANLILDDKIDILVDLALHMASNRLMVMAQKPAPVQVTFGGYPGTTGLTAIDYRLTDPYLDPPSTVEGGGDADYSEQSIPLPDSFWCFDPQAMDVEQYEIVPLPAIASGHITFGCLNNFCKVNDGVLELWARVLNEIPGSRLILLTPPGPPRQRVIDKFYREGIEEIRLEFISRIKREEYLQMYRRIDLGLDTFPYNGHTTSLDSLWMGVPVVTLVGSTAVGKAGWSQLCNLDLRELAARSPDEFVRIAADLARNQEKLSELRSTLRNRMRKSPLCDAGRFTRGIESAYRQMWRTWIS